MRTMMLITIITLMTMAIAKSDNMDSDKRNSGIDKYPMCKQVDWFERSWCETKEFQKEGWVEAKEQNKRTWNTIKSFFIK